MVARFTISIVSNSIYNVDPKTFEGQESEILKKGRMFTAPSMRMLIVMTLTKIYPFLSKHLKFGFSQPGAENFFIDLMSDAIKNRERNKIKRVDYLDHLINLKNKKQITGKCELILTFEILSLVFMYIRY